jgi:hypothetical protein
MVAFMDLSLSSATHAAFARRTSNPVAAPDELGFRPEDVVAQQQGLVLLHMESLAADARWAIEARMKTHGWSFVTIDPSTHCAQPRRRAKKPMEQMQLADVLFSTTRTVISPHDKLFLTLQNLDQTNGVKKILEGTGWELRKIFPNELLRLSNIKIHK